MEENINPVQNASDGSAGQPGAPTTPSERQAPSGLDLSSRMADIMRRERALQERESSFKSQSGELENWNRVKSAKNPEEKLKAIGLDYNQLTQHFLNKSDNDQIEELKTRLAELEGTTRQTHEQLTQRQMQELEQQSLSDIKAMLSESAEQFPLVSAFDESDTIWHMVNGYYQKTGQIMTYNDAAKAIEDELKKKFSGLKGHKESPWLRELLELEQKRDEGSEMPSKRQTWTEEPSIVHTLANSFRGGSPSSLSEMSGGSNSSQGATRSDSQARDEALALIRKQFGRG